MFELLEENDVIVIFATHNHSEFGDVVKNFVVGRNFKYFKPALDIIITRLNEIVESLSDIHKEEFINKLFYVKGIIDENIENGLINEVPIGLLVDHLIDIVDENIINAVAKYVTDKYPKIDDDCGELFNAKLFGIIMTSTNFAILPLLHFMSNRSELGSQAFEIENQQKKY